MTKSFFEIFFICIKMSKHSYAKYYQENKERLQKRCFFIWVFFKHYLQFTGQQEKEELIITPLYYFTDT